MRAKATDPHTGRVLPADLAIEEAERRGLIPEGAVTASSYHRHARRLGHKRVKPCRRFEASRANECHQVDVSGSEYLSPERSRNGGRGWAIRVLRQDQKPYKNRPRRGEGRPKLWCFLVVDDRSRVSWGKYFIAPGENAADILLLLAEAWGDRGEWTNPLKGIPDGILCDKGPLVKNEAGKKFLELAGVEVLPRLPFNPRADGKVERQWRTQWSRFELRYLLEPERELTLGEVNEDFSVYLAEENSRAHPIYGDRTRSQVYLSSLGQVRLLPADAAALAFREEIRLVRQDCAVIYQGKAYQAPAEWIGERVTVSRSIDGRVVLSLGGETITAELLQPQALGDWRTEEGIYADTPADRIRKEAKATDLGGRAGSRVQRFKGSTRVAPPFGAERHEVETPFSDRVTEYTVDGARAALGRAFGRPYTSLPPAVVRPFEELLERERTVRAIDQAIEAILGELSRAKEAGA